MAELVQDKVLGAMRFVDATTLLKVDGPLQVKADNTVVRTNRSGLYVIWSAPAAASVVFTVTDPGASYLPRTFTVQLPRDPDPANAAQPSSLFQPLEVRLLPSSTATIFSGWAVIRARVKKQGQDQVLSGALIRVVNATDQSLMATGMSDARGEALVRVPGVPVTTFDSGSGPVTVNEISVNIQTVFDPAITGVPDPDDLEKRKNSVPSSTAGAKLASGRVLVVDLSVAFA